MSGTEWNDDEAGYPSAPIPPHERPWRHPSELGPGRAIAGPPAWRPSRPLVVSVGVLGVVIVGALVQLLTPRGGTSVSEVAAHGGPWADATRRPSGSSSGLAAVPTTSTPVARRNPKRPVPLATMVVSRSHRPAVAVGDGSHALTIATSLSPAQVLEVHVRGGATVLARVKSINRARTVAVLELQRPLVGAALRVATAPPNDGGHVSIGESGVDAVVHRVEGGYVLGTDQTIVEGSPVLDDDGLLLGLAQTDSSGIVHLLPIPSSSALDAMLLVIDVWLGLRFENGSLAVAEIANSAPAALGGVRVGDRLTSIAGIRLESIDDLWSELAHLHPGDVVKLVVDRAGTPVTAEVELARRPS